MSIRNKICSIIDGRLYSQLFCYLVIFYHLLISMLMCLILVCGTLRIIYRIFKFSQVFIYQRYNFVYISCNYPSYYSYCTSCIGNKDPVSTNPVQLARSFPLNLTMFVISGANYLFIIRPTQLSATLFSWKEARESVVL